jgi:HEPN domain-containing protein
MPMTEEEKFDYWYDHARYDLETADAMFESKRWIYVVFTCQQSLEKLTKGLYGLYLGFNEIPRIHDIPALVKRFEEKLPSAIPAEYHDLFRELSLFYLNTRYPKYAQRLSEILNKDRSNAMLVKTKEAFAWLLTMKP